MSDIIAALPAPLPSIIDGLVGLSSPPYDTKEAREEPIPIVPGELVSLLAPVAVPAGATRRAESGANDLPQHPPTLPPSSAPQVPSLPVAAVSPDDNTQPPAAPVGNTPSPLAGLPVNPLVPPPPTVQAPTGLPAPSPPSGAPGRRDSGIDVPKQPLVDDTLSGLPLSPRNPSSNPVLPIISGLPISIPISD